MTRRNFLWNSGGGLGGIALADVMRAGHIGAFALTESGAGVLSGLIVETTATWAMQSTVICTSLGDG